MADGKIDRVARAIAQLRAEVKKRIVGQDDVLRQVLAAILAEGHALIVGLPGLAKTLIVSSVAQALSLEFRRIQFTPDLMPSDIMGATIIGEDGAGHRGFRFLRGPIFSNVILADEINRTPPKTQSALMEAMEERQVSAGGQRLVLERPFFVLATQNPIELEGTYPLPVSQLDRFLFKIVIDYPSAEEELRVLLRTTTTYDAVVEPVLSREEVVETLDAARRVEVGPKLLDYASRVVRATRPGSAAAPHFIRELVAWGGGPRATQSVLAAARAFALMDGRPAVTAEDIHAAVLPALRHRIILRYHAEAEGLTADDVVMRTLRSMPDGLYREEAAPRGPAARPGLLQRILGKR